MRPWWGTVALLGACWLPTSTRPPRPLADMIRTNQWAFDGQVKQAPPAWSGPPARLGSRTTRPPRRCTPRLAHADARQGWR
eukprot:1076173-Prymnesium_polylepis.2